MNFCDNDFENSTNSIIFIRISKVIGYAITVKFLIKLMKVNKKSVWTFLRRMPKELFKILNL